jgi:hypothetical protein
MKNKLLFLKQPGLGLMVIMLSVGLLTSCSKKDESVQTTGLMGFKYNGPSQALHIAFPSDTAYLAGTATDVMSLEVNLAVPSGLFSAPVSATIVPDAAALIAYNEGIKTYFFPEPLYQQLPASLYTLKNGGKVTINPGQKSVKIGVNFAGDKIDFFNNNAFKNALSLKLINAQGATLDSALSKAVVIIAAKNPYAGNYHAVGKTSRSDLPDNHDANHSYDIKMQPLTIVTPNTVQTEMPDSHDPIYLTVNPDNSVKINFLQGVPGPFFPFGTFPALIVTSFSSVGPYTQNGVNKYDPSTKTFTLNYQYYGGIGSVSETLTLMN